MAQLPDIFRKAWATRWFVYMPPNQIYLNPLHGLIEQFDKPIYLKKSPANKFSCYGCYQQYDESQSPTSNDANTLNEAYY